MFSEIHYANIQLVSTEHRNLVGKSTVTVESEDGLRVSKRTAAELLLEGP